MPVITSVEILKVPPSWVWLKIHTDTGITGLGEPYLEDHGDSVIAEVRRMEPLLIGRDALRIERIWHDLYTSGNGYRGGPVTMSAISGIDMALWDIAGKAYGVPIHAMIGGATRDRVKVYRAVVGETPHTVTPGEPYRSRPLVQSPNPSDWAREASELVEQWGFRTLKLHVNPGARLEATRDVDRLAANFHAVRAAVGTDIDLAIDIHNPHPRIAEQLIAEIASARPLFVEEPVPLEYPASLREIARKTSVPLAAGERWMGKWAFAEAMRGGALAVAQPDLAHAGGITEVLKIAALAEAFNTRMAPHCPLSPIALAASIQLDAVIPNFLVQEHNEVNATRVDGKTRIGAGYIALPFVVGEDGCVDVPRGPGLGITLDDDGLRDVMRHSWSSSRA